MVYDRDGRPKGIAYIEFGDKEDLVKALCTDGNVSWAGVFCCLPRLGNLGACS
jgi:hypothetical protein